MIFAVPVIALVVIVTRVAPCPVASSSALMSIGKVWPAETLNTTLVVSFDAFDAV